MLCNSAFQLTYYMQNHLIITNQIITIQRKIEKKQQYNDVWNSVAFGRKCAVKLRISQTVNPALMVITSVREIQDNSQSMNKEMTSGGHAQFVDKTLCNFLFLLLLSGPMHINRDGNC